MAKNLQKQLPAPPFSLSMLENSKMHTSVTRKVFSEHCTGVGRSKMRGEHNFSTLMTKVVGCLFAQLCLTKALFIALVIEKTRGQAN